MMFTATRSGAATVCAGIGLVLAGYHTSGVADAQQAPSAPAGLAVGNSGSDTMPPVISLATASSITSSGATITWTTNKLSNSQVDFGLTIYNSASPLNTSLVTSHTVTLSGLAQASLYHFRARSRDGAGNLGISGNFTFTTLASSGVGIAALYPGDVGIEGDTHVVFVEKFDETSLSTMQTRWTDILNPTGMVFSADVPPGSPIAHSLDIPSVGGGVNNGGHLYKLLTPGVTDTLYIRYYIKYPATAYYTHTGIWMGGYNPPLSWPNPQAGIKPIGNDRFSASAEQNLGTARFDHYDYWMGMHLSLDNNYWGNLLLNNPNTQASSGQWTCVEHMVKLNNPVTASNGEHAIWLNGVMVSHLGQGFPNGSWTGGIFTQDPNGTPFQGFQWRSDANLNLNYIWLQNFSPSGPAGSQADMMFAHVVAATSRVGCLASGGPDTTPPTVSMTAPGAGSRVSGSAVTLSATASDDVGVVGVQFKLDGTNQGTESTGSPYSISWNTTSVANGSHTLTAVARDAAGNATTSGGVTVTVSNSTGSAWPNEPAGLTVRTDWGFDQAPPTSGDVSISGSPGWKIVENALPGSPRGWTSLVVDPTAPFSPSSVYDFVYPQGMVEGNAPSTVYYAGLGAREVYAGFWWKPSSPFDFGPDGNKIAFIFNGGGGAGGQQFLIIHPDGMLHVLPEYPGDFQWRDPNVNATVVTLGAWHRVEWYTNVTTGTLKWWLDGVLQGSYSNVLNSFNFDMFQFSPTWGGNIGAQKRETDHYWFDHVHVSTR